MAYLNRVHSSVLEAESSGYEPGEVFNMAKSTKDGVGLTGFVAPQRGKAIDPAKVVSGKDLSFLGHDSNDVLELYQNA